MSVFLACIYHITRAPVAQGSVQVVRKTFRTLKGLCCGGAAVKSPILEMSKKYLKRLKEQSLSRSWNANVDR